MGRRFPYSFARCHLVVMNRLCQLNRACRSSGEREQERAYGSPGNSFAG